MQSITFSSLPVSPSRVTTGNTKDFQINQGKQNKVYREQQHDGSLQNTMSRLINRTSQQFHLQKSIVKELSHHLKSKVVPEREKLLSQLVLNEQHLSSLKEITKKQHFKTVELRSLCHKLKMEKEKQQNLLSQIIEKNLRNYTQIEQNEFRKHNLSKYLEQITDRNQQKMIMVKSQQQSNTNKLSKFKNSFNHLAKISKQTQNFGKYSVEDDLQLQTAKNFVQNAQIHGQELKDCLSHRFQHLIRLKESKYDKETRLVLFGQQNSMLQNQINRLADDIELAEANRKEAIDEINEEEFKLNSVHMQNTELRARLEILQHSMNDQIKQSKQKQQTIQDLQKQNNSAHFSSVQTQSYLSKLIELKLQSEYLQTRLKQSLSK